MGSDQDNIIWRWISERSLTMAYDGTNRLIIESEQRNNQNPVNTSFFYDEADNRIRREVTGGKEPGTTLYEFGDGFNGAGANQLKKQTRPGGHIVTYGYDPNGNRTTRSENGRTDTYSYDDWDHLTSLDFQTPQKSAQRGAFEYGYDFRARRVSRYRDGATTRCTYQGGLNVEEFDASITGPPTVNYIRGNGMGGGIGGMLYSVRDGHASMSHSNVRGDVYARVNEQGHTTWSTNYQAFGTHPEHCGENPDPQRANTKEQDPTNLLNEGHRYRDLETGTFITRDPAGFIDGPNLYTYVGQNPWSSFDPLGLSDTWQWSGWDWIPGVQLAHLAFDLGAIPSEGAIGLVEGQDQIYNAKLRQLDDAMSLDFSNRNSNFEQNKLQRLARGSGNEIQLGVEKIQKSAVDLAFTPGTSFTGPASGPISPAAAAATRNSKIMFTRLGGPTSKIPNGLTLIEFQTIRKMVNREFADLGEGIYIHGSRVVGRNAIKADLDIMIRMNPLAFGSHVNKVFGNPTVGSAKWKTMQKAILEGRVLGGDNGSAFSRIRKKIKNDLDLQVQISVIQTGGTFDSSGTIKLID